MDFSKIDKQVDSWIIQAYADICISIYKDDLTAKKLYELYKTMGIFLLHTNNTENEKRK